MTAETADEDADVLPFSFLDHAPAFIDQWNALPYDATADDAAKVMYDDWLVLPVPTISDHIDIRLVTEGHVTVGGNRSNKLVVCAGIEQLSQHGVQKPLVALEDMIVGAFRIGGRFMNSPDILASAIRAAVESGIERGLAIAWADEDEEWTD